MKRYNNIEEVGTVYKTKQYNIFKIMKDNRDLRKVKELSKKMNLSKEYPFNTPIIVNEKMQVIDGQHRLFLAKGVEKYVYFIQVKGATIDDVIDMNTIKNEWKVQDFIKSYSNRGNVYYKIIQDLQNKHKDEVELSAISILALMTSDGKLISENVLREGRLVFDVKDAWNNWYSNYPKYLDIVNVLKRMNKNGYAQKYCISSFVIMFNNEHYDHEHFLKQLEKYSYMFKTSIYNRKYFLEIFEDIYNYNSRKRPLRLFQQ